MQHLLLVQVTVLVKLELSGTGQTVRGDLKIHSVERVPSSAHHAPRDQQLLIPNKQHAGVLKVRNGTGVRGKNLDPVSM
jgi:hypothetical protein